MLACTGKPAAASLQVVRRAAIVLAVALPLAAADLVWKGLATTPSWAYHTRSPAWLVLSASLVLLAVGLAWIRLAALPLFAGVMAGGVLGNALSASWNGLRVPNPIVASAGEAVIAFNLADVFTAVGILSLTGSLALVLVRNRNVLPTPREARAMCADAFRRRF